MGNEKFIDETGIWEGLTNTKLSSFLNSPSTDTDAVDDYINIVYDKYIQKFGLPPKIKGDDDAIVDGYIDYYIYFGHSTKAENAKKFIMARRVGKPTEKKSLKVLAFISYYLSVEKKNCADSVLARILEFADITTDYSSQLDYLKENQLLLAELFFVFLCLDVKRGSHASEDDEDWIGIKRNVIKTFLDSAVGAKEELRTSLLECLSFYSNRVGELRNKTFQEIYVDTDYQKDVDRIIDSIANQKGALKKYSYLVQGPAQSGKSMILQKLAIDLSKKKSLVFLNSNILNSVSNLPDLEDFSNDSEAAKNFLYTVFLEAFTNNDHTFNGFFGYENRNRSAFKYCRMDSSSLNIPISTVYIIDALDEFNVDVRNLVLKSIEALVNDGDCNCSIIVSTRQLSKETMNKIHSSMGIDINNLSNVLTIKGFSAEAKRRLFDKLSNNVELEENQYEESLSNEYLSVLTRNPFLFTKYLVSNTSTAFDLVKYICDSANIKANTRDDSESLLNTLGDAASWIYICGKSSYKLYSQSPFKENDLIKTGIVVPKEESDGNEYVFINGMFAGYIYALYIGDDVLEIKKGMDHDFLMAFMFDPDKVPFPSKPTIMVNQSAVFYWVCENGEFRMANQIMENAYSLNYFGSEIKSPFIEAVYDKSVRILKSKIPSKEPSLDGAFKDEPN